MKSFAFAFCIVIWNGASAGGGEVGNGGDAVVQEFQFLGKETVKLIPHLRTTALTYNEVKQLKGAIEGATVESKEQLFLNGIEVDAINYPSQKKIEISRSRWREPGNANRERRWALAVHEYLWLAGVDDTSYKVSSQLFPDFVAAKQRWLSTPIAKALTQAICSGILGRDILTVEQALEMGADLSATCQNEWVEYKCRDGRTGRIWFRNRMEPFVLAMETMGQDYCAVSNFDPDLDQEMAEYLAVILRYKPDLTKRDYGPLSNESLLNMAARSKRYLAYVAFLAAGVDPNAVPDFGGLLRWWPFPPLKFFKAALDAGANINLPSSEDKTRVLSAHIVRQAKRDVMEFMVSQGKIDFCLNSTFRNLYNEPVPIYELALPEYKPFLQSVGGPCIP